jgi:four helix bundle protein
LIRSKVQPPAPSLLFTEHRPQFSVTETATGADSGAVSVTESGADTDEKFYHRTIKINAPTHLRDQLARASSSIALNTAEAAGRWDAPTDRKRFFRMALGSLRESVAILDLLGNNEPRIRQLADSLGAMLYTLSRP